MHKYYAITTPVRTLTRFAHPCNVALGSPAGEVSRAANGSFRSSLAVPPRPRERPESALCSRRLTMRRMGEDAPIRPFTGELEEGPHAGNRALLEAQGEPVRHR